ncbi:carbon-nitrogen hydrolase family protein [Nocardia cyriacigeorgica]|uniref:carbon-nitrogen hydrolase family protein n=1 Tax=Nocardia cyriacigeorgica TaxID=135487 RepID=UPI001893EB77|nr:carbon-nitrogen hydrolase family protein [Nocardia cyriacigeorgica]MBF6440237.1 carbon-nitrogen hydrolase family protein [Nocardia cyriacigeorgica]
MSIAAVRAALCQITSTADPSHNLSQVRAAVGRAAEQGARIVVFPEATMACFGTPLAAVAEPLDGQWARALAEIADDHGVLIAAGMFTPAGERVRNTVLLTGLGYHLGYHKIHLYDAFGYRESDTVAAGTDYVTVSVDGLVLGVATCYDVRFPALFQQLAERGASAIMLPTSWGAGKGKVQQWQTLVRARALDSGSWILACDQADPRFTGLALNPSAPTGIGRSMVADPFGRVVDRLESGPGMLVVTIDAATATAARAATGVLANRAMCNRLTAKH